MLTLTYVGVVSEDMKSDFHAPYSLTPKRNGSVLSDANRSRTRPAAHDLNQVPRMALEDEHRLHAPRDRVGCTGPSNGLDSYLAAPGIEELICRAGRRVGRK